MINQYLFYFVLSNFIVNTFNSSSCCQYILVMVKSNSEDRDRSQMVYMSGWHLTTNGMNINGILMSLGGGGGGVSFHKAILATYS